MFSKCEECGRTFGILYKKHKLSDGRIVCYECLEKFPHQIVKKEQCRKRVKECEECGRRFGILYKKHKLSDGRIVCYECLNKYIYEFEINKKFEKNMQETIERMNKLTHKEPKINIDDIKELMSKKQIDEAEIELNRLENQYKEYTKINIKLRDIKIKIESLTDKLADGTIDSKAYNRALTELEKKQKAIIENLWKLKNILFKQDYEKPF